ncbi:MAG: class I SAM-dependent rRNA methyltransferase, partial [Bdellovibrio sp.]
FCSQKRICGIKSFAEDLPKSGPRNRLALAKLMSLILKPGFEKKIKSRHPWIFMSEIRNNIGDLPQGSIQELWSESGHFLARGFVNPRSQIAFRAWTFRRDEVWSEELFLRRLLEAWKRRRAWHCGRSSRLVYSEADDLPGLNLDLYALKAGQVLVWQLNSAGMEKLLSQDFEKRAKEFVQRAYLKGWSPFAAEESTHVILRNSSARKKEGLEIQPPEVYGAPLQVPQNIFLGPPSQAPVQLSFDVLKGQKTGLFLDQSENISWLTQFLQKKSPGSLRVLDLCCYVGQWSASLATALANWELQVDLLDASETAIEFAKINLLKVLSSSQVRGFVCDVMQEWPEELLSSYDLIISDPPAFVKSRADLGSGLRAYEKLNLKAARKLSANGLLVSCSCSGRVSLSDFQASLAQAALRSGQDLRLIHTGDQAVDHPVRPWFPEAQYLKCLVFSNNC